MTSSTESPASDRVEPEASRRLKRAATYASVSVALVLTVAKAVAWLVTGSVSMLSTLIDSLLDLAASVVNLLAVRQAQLPADRKHRFGYGKAEPVAGLVQGAFVCGSAAFLLFEAGERLYHPVAVANSEVGFAVIGFSIVLTAALVLYQRYVIRRTDSVAISADSLHYSADLLVNVSVIVALVLSVNFGWAYADPLIAIVIAFFILKGAIQIIRESLDLLMDRELPDDDRERIRKIATTHPSVIGMHDLRTRSSGPATFIQLHLEMDGEITLHDAHIIAESVMAEIETAFPGAEVLVHEDPHGIPERRAVFK